MSSVVSTFFLAKCEAGLTSPKMRPWAAKYLPLVVDPFKAIISMYGELHLPTLAFAISNSPYMQTEQAFQAWIDGYKPSAEQIYYIMADARPARTPKMLQAFIAAKPTAKTIYSLMRDCGDFARTPEMVKLFLAAKPSAAELAWSLKDCGQVAQTPEVIAAFLAAKPTADLIYKAMRYGGEFARTPEMLRAFINAKPDAEDIRRLIEACGDFAQTPELLALATA